MVFQTISNIKNRNEQILTGTCKVFGEERSIFLISRNKNQDKKRLKVVFRDLKTLVRM